MEMKGWRGLPPSYNFSKSLHSIDLSKHIQNQYKKGGESNVESTQEIKAFCISLQLRKIQDASSSLRHLYAEVPYIRQKMVYQFQHSKRMVGKRRKSNKSHKLMLAVIFALIFHSNVYAKTININIKRIAEIESSMNAKAHNAGEDARGLFQIRQCVLTEYNLYNNTHHTKDDLFMRSINIKIAKWYIGKRIPEMLRHFNKKITERNVVVCYNAGINYIARDLEIPEITKAYLQKYFKR